MRARIVDLGKDLGVCIPRAIAVRTGLKAGVLVEITVHGDELHVRRVRAAALSLASLLSRVTTGNLHAGVSTGHVIGAECW